MQPSFKLIFSPDVALVQRLADRDPENLFITPEFMRAMELRGFKPCLLGLWDQDEPVEVCLGAFKKGRLSSELDIRLLPDVSADSPFWTGLGAECRRLGVWDLTVYAVTARPGAVVPLGPLAFTESGEEYHVPLGTEPVPQPTSTNLRRNVAKARKAGLVIRRTRDPSVIETHIDLMDLSMDRRKERGEEVSGRVQHRYYEAMLKAGAGEFFQALDPAGTTLSSVFFIRSKGAAYYQSAGTSPEGMALGASPFLIWSTAEQLRQEGLTKFCLGGSTLDNTGLVRFKLGFGSQAVPFVSMGFNMAPALKRKLRTLLRLIKSGPKAWMRSLAFVDRYPVFAADVTQVPAPEPRPELVLEKLHETRLRELCQAKPEFHRQAERLDEFPFNDAWGVFLDGELAHVSWMVTPEHDKLCAERNLKLENGEVEITHCFTSATHRGKGLYPYAIRALAAQARAQGFKRVLMITHETNQASIQGITKAGLQAAGLVRQLRLPLVSPNPVWISRGHRR